MKKLIILVAFITYAGFAKGQQAGDFLMKGKALIETGKPDDAIGVLTDALGQKSDSRVYLERADAYILKGDYTKAIADLNSANSITSTSGEFGLARIYALKGNASTAVYHLELCLKSAFRKSEKEILLDPSFSVIENSPQWRQFWKNDWYSELEKGLAEIEYDISTGNISEAKNTLKQLSGTYPGKEENVYAGALVSFSESKYAEVVKDVTGLINTDPQNEKYLRLLAKAQESAGNPAGASSTYTKLLDLGVADASLLMFRAECYNKTGEADRAAADLSKYLSLYPGDMKALEFAGKIESASGNNLKALEYFSENLKKHPGDPQCYIDRANAYFVSKSWDLAANDYSMSLDLQPGNPDVWLNKGISLLNKGNTEDACHDFRMAFNLGSRKSTEYISKNCIK
jgi:tetratricopeptide (TPR) repeat protein